MPLDEHTLYRAKRSDRQAMQQVLESVYEPVYRMAYALSGRGDVGDGVVRFVMVQSLKRLAAFRDVDDLRRWFYHHTVLTCRRAAAHRPKAGQDMLAVPGSPAEYFAFVSALRKLPTQQSEAFILHHGQGFDQRAMAIAMDCSTTAADMHMKAAQEALAAIVGSNLTRFIPRMKATYDSLAPDESLVRPKLAEYIGRSLWPRRLKRWVTIFLTIILLGALWWIYRRLGIFIN